MLPPDQQFQEDVAARLQADTVLAPIGLIREQDGVTDSDAALALGPARAGGVAGAQAGSLIVVQQTSDGSDLQPNLPGPREGFRLVVRVLELPKLARVQPGYISFFVVAARIKALLHLFQLGTSPVLYVRGTPYNDGQGTVGKDLTFSWVPAPQIIQAVAQPAIVLGVPGSVSVTSGTPGAQIYVTEDGSLPTPANGQEQASGTAFPAPVAGTLVRAVAYAPNMIPSGVTEFQF